MTLCFDYALFLPKCETENLKKNELNDRVFDFQNDYLFPLFINNLCLHH